MSDNDLLRCEAAQGKCRVMCFHPQSNITLPLMSHGEVRLVVDEWARISTELGAKFTWVQVFFASLTTHSGTKNVTVSI